MRGAAMQYGAMLEACHVLLRGGRGEVAGSRGRGRGRGRGPPPKKRRWDSDDDFSSAATSEEEEDRPEYEGEPVSA